MSMQTIKQSSPENPKVIPIGSPDLLKIVQRMFGNEAYRICKEINNTEVHAGVEGVINGALEKYFHVGVPANNECYNKFQGSFSKGEN